MQGCIEVVLYTRIGAWRSEWGVCGYRSRNTDILQRGVYAGLYRLSAVHPHRRSEWGGNDVLCAHPMQCN
eukprot:4036881-Prymnesium_polylepis.3